MAAASAGMRADAGRYKTPRLRMLKWQPARNKLSELPLFLIGGRVALRTWSQRLRSRRSCSLDKVSDQSDSAFGLPLHVVPNCQYVRRRRCGLGKNIIIRAHGLDHGFTRICQMKAGILVIPRDTVSQFGACHVDILAPRVVDPPKDLLEFIPRGSLYGYVCYHVKTMASYVPDCQQFRHRNLIPQSPGIRQERPRHAFG